MRSLKLQLTGSLEIAKVEESSVGLRELDRMTFKEVESYLKSGPGLVVVPIGSTEEHGAHGPMGADTFCARLVSKKVAELVDGILAPAVPYGMAQDQINFKGTVSLRPSTLALLMRELCENFIRDKYRLVLMISGHRGNDHAVMTGIQEVGFKSKTHLLYMSYQDANRGRLREILGEEYAGNVNAEDMRYGADGHAGSIELSIAMAHVDGCVRLDRRQTPDRSKADALRSFPFKSILNMEETAPTEGFFGDPGFCSAELGERVAQKTAEVIAAEVRRYLEAFPERFERSA
jgi:creatinine amidohydrolase